MWFAFYCTAEEGKGKGVELGLESVATLRFPGAGLGVGILKILLHLMLARFKGIQGLVGPLLCLCHFFHKENEFIFF